MVQCLRSMMNRSLPGIQMLLLPLSIPESPSSRYSLAAVPAINTRTTLPHNTRWKAQEFPLKLQKKEKLYSFGTELKLYF